MKHVRKAAIIEMKEMNKVTELKEMNKTSSRNQNAESFASKFMTTNYAFPRAEHNLKERAKIEKLMTVEW